MRITRASGTASEAIGRPSLSSPPPTPAPSAPLDATLAPGAPRPSSSVGVGMLSDRSDRARPSPIATLLPPALPPLPPLMLPPPLALPPVEEDRLRGAGPRSSSVWKMSTDGGTNRITVEPSAPLPLLPTGELAVGGDRWSVGARPVLLPRLAAFLGAWDDTFEPFVRDGAAMLPKSNGDSGSGAAGLRRRGTVGRLAAAPGSDASLLSYSNSSDEAVEIATDQDRNEMGEGEGDSSDGTPGGGVSAGDPKLQVQQEADAHQRHYYYHYCYYYYYHYLLLPSVGASSHGCSGHDRAGGRWAKGRGADRVLDGWGALAGRDRARASSKGR
uniref:Uncharacterized protein n=1 Tax=Anopheles merus TaxID=30066 RepID=A0A182VDS7_ANOME